MALNPTNYSKSNPNASGYGEPSGELFDRLLEDGTSFRLLEDGTSKRLLESGIGNATNYVAEDAN